MGEALLSPEADEVLYLPQKMRGHVRKFQYLKIVRINRGN